MRIPRSGAMEPVKEHVKQYYAYHGIEVTRSNAETCVVSLPPQFRDLSAFTADVWTEFGVVVDIAIMHGSMEATLRFDNGTKEVGGSGLFLFLSVLVIFVAMVLGVVYIPFGNELVNITKV